MKKSLFTLGMAVAITLGSRAASPVPELALPASDGLASLDASLLIDDSPGALMESDSGLAPEGDPLDPPLDGPIQPESGAVPALSEPLARPWKVQFRVRVAATYDDNIFIQPTHKEADLLLHFAPGFTFVLGDPKLAGSYLSLSYDADAVFFLDHSDLNAVDQNLLVRGQYHPGLISLGAFFQFQDLTSSDKEVGTRVNRKLYSGGVSARWPFSDKTALEVELEARQSDYETQLDTTEALVRTWLEYQYSPLTEVSAGVTAGTIEVSSGGRQNYVQGLARVKYDAAAKVKVQLRAGVELRESESGQSTVTPVFNLGLVYAPYPLLDVRLDAYRLVQPSVSTVGVNTAVTGVSAGLTYRFLGRFSAGLTGGYEHSEYESLGGSVRDTRADNYLFVRSGLQYSLTDRCTVGAFYEFRRNTSSKSDRSFQNDQTGLEMAFAF